jgi:hypothetical protein
MPKGSFRKKRLSHSLDDDPNSTFEAGGLNAKTASDQATMNTNINEYPAPFLSLVGLPYILVDSSPAFSYYACGPTVQGESHSEIPLTLGFCAVVGMNIIKKFKQHWEQAKNYRHNAEAQSNICNIPVSHLNGIATLPTELWSLILSHVVIDHLAHPYYKSRDFPFILSYRLVCRPSLPSLRPPPPPARSPRSSR